MTAAPDARFRLAADGLTVSEHHSERNVEDETIAHGETLLFTFNPDVMPESREDIVRWLNTGFAHEAALRSGRSS
jgi:hypothetical protein